MLGMILTHAWRSWRNSKAVAFLAIIALAAGIGSATAIYTVVNGVMLKPLRTATATGLSYCLQRR
jgi:hypothetical protein